MEHEFGYYVNIGPHRMWNSKNDIAVLCNTTRIFSDSTE